MNHLNVEQELEKIREEIDLVINEKVAHLKTVLELSNDETSTVQQRLSQHTHRTYLRVRNGGFEELGNKHQTSLTINGLMETIDNLPDSVEQI